jgi:hypothetical protein
MPQSIRHLHEELGQGQNRQEILTHSFVCPDSQGGKDKARADARFEQSLQAGLAARQLGLVDMDPTPGVPAEGTGDVSRECRGERFECVERARDPRMVRGQ